jgi:hypothetical protein
LQNQRNLRESAGPDDESDGKGINYRESGGLPENYGQGYADQSAQAGTGRKISLHNQSGQSGKSTENSTNTQSSPASGNDIADMPQKDQSTDVERPLLPQAPPLPYELHQQMEAARLRERVNPIKLYQKQMPQTGETPRDEGEN